MSAYFVTRHPGAIEWARNKGIDAVFVEHLDADMIENGDIVYGTLPVSEAARVCERGGKYFHLALNMPKARRGGELSAADMDAFGAKLEEYEVRRV